MNKKKAFRGLLALAVVLAVILPFTIGQADYFSSSLNIQSFGVRNLSRGEYTFNPQTSASVNEQLEFSLSVNNYSGNTIRNASLQVTLPSGLNMTSSYITVDGYSNNSNWAERIYLGDIYSGSSKQVVFRATVNNNTYNNNYTVYVYASGDNSSSVSGSVTINSSNNNCYYNNCYGYNNLRLSVLGRNISRGGDLVKNFSAQPGDTVEFSLRVNTDSGNTARNVYLGDSLDSYLEFIPGTVRSDGGYTSDSLINSNGLFIGDLYSGNYRTVTFQARVASDYRFPQREIIASNTARLRADNTTTVTESSSITITNYGYYNTPTPYPTYQPRYYPAPTPIVIYRTVPAPTPIVVYADQNQDNRYINPPRQQNEDKQDSTDSTIRLNDLGIVVFVLLIVVLILLFMLWRMDRNRLEEALRNR